MGRKSSTITLSFEDRAYLETQTKARTIQAQTVARARILLLKADGYSIEAIADKVDMNRKSVMLCINKFNEGGIENALFDAPGRGRNAEITDDEKAWIINIACQKPVDLGYSAEVWTRALLTKHINKFAEEAGHTRLSTISQSKVRTILEEADIKPNKIKYKRLGTISLLTGIDLQTGEAIPLVKESHNSNDYVEFLKLLDNKYPKEEKIRLVLDNLKVHSSVETRKYLATVPGRFEFVFTPKQGSWLNLVEGFFSKMTRQMLKGIRVKTKDELVERIYKYFEEANEEPVVYHWKYKLDEIDPNEEVQVETLPLEKSS